MKRNICLIKNKTSIRKTIIKTLGLSLAMALVLTPVANLAVVRDNVGGMDTSVSQEGNTPNGGATENQILEGYGAYVDGVLVEGNIPTANVTDATINNLSDTVTIPGHTYIDEDLTIGLSSSFLKDATNGATATANKMLQGETAYVNGELITGTIPSLAAKTYTPGTTNQTITSGKYLSGTQTISGDADLISTNIKSGVNIFGVTGNSNVVDTSAGNATATQILKDKVAYVDGELVVGTIPSLIAKTYTPGTTNQTIASGKYLSGTQTISGDADLISTNIKFGVEIFGVTGNSNVVDTSAGTATSTQILKDKVAYVDGSKLTGTMTDNANATKDATVITKSGDKALITIPSAGYYDTSSKISVPIETISSVYNSFTLQNTNSASGTSSITVNLPISKTGLYLILFTRNYSTSGCPTKTISGLNNLILSYNSPDTNGNSSGVAFSIGYAEAGKTISCYARNDDGGSLTFTAKSYLIN